MRADRTWFFSGKLLAGVLLAVSARGLVAYDPPPPGMLIRVQ